MQADIRIGKYTSTFGGYDLIGKGGFGDVYVGHEISNPDNKVAIKVINVEESKKTKRKADQKTLKEKVSDQIQLLFNYRSKGVVEILAYSLVKLGANKQQHYAIVMQKMDSSLAKLMEKQLNTDESLGIAWKIAQCYEDLYKENVIHRDLKPDNVLYKKIGNQTLFKLADFGFARDLHLSPIKTKATAVNSRGYSSPQLLRGQKITAKADLYSFAVILSEMLTGSDDILAQTGDVYGQEDYEKNKQAVKKILHKSNIQKPIIDFIEACLIYDEQKRMSWELAYKHQIFKGFSKKAQKFEKQQETNIVKKNGRFRITPDTTSLGFQESNWKLDNKNNNVCIVKIDAYPNWLCSSPLPSYGEFVFTIKIIKWSVQIQFGVMETDKKGEDSVDTKNHCVYLDPIKQWIQRPKEVINCSCSSQLPKCPFQIDCHVDRQQNTIAWHYAGKQQAKSILPKAWKTQRKQLCAIVYFKWQGGSVEMM